MHSLSLIDYIKVYNIIEQNSIKSILHQLQEEDLWKRHQWTNSENNDVVRQGDEELFVSDGSLSEQYNLIMSNIYNSISNYIRDVNIPEFTYWQGYTPLRFNRYKENQTMLKHIDRIKSIFDGTRRGVPILSVVGLLNDNFSGGDFIMFDDYKVNLKAGDIMIFPSSFTFPHQVTHITEGTRYSFVSWVW
jgi:predicted 2-oxoglutarate/Fe(II)-dependent dioxygenase YbiX